MPWLCLYVKMLQVERKRTYHPLFTYSLLLDLVGMPPPHRDWITVENDFSESEAGKQKQPLPPIIFLYNNLHGLIFPP